MKKQQSLGQGVRVETDLGPGTIVGSTELCCCSKCMKLLPDEEDSPHDPAFAWEIKTDLHPNVILRFPDQIRPLLE